MSILTTRRFHEIEAPSPDAFMVEISTIVVNHARDDRVGVGAFAFARLKHTGSVLAWDSRWVQKRARYLRQPLRAGPGSLREFHSGDDVARIGVFAISDLMQASRAQEATDSQVLFVPRESVLSVENVPTPGQPVTWQAGDMKAWLHASDCITIEFFGLFDDRECGVLVSGAKRHRLEVLGALNGA
jgi:hypothetical protein